MWNALELGVILTHPLVSFILWNHMCYFTLASNLPIMGQDCAILWHSSLNFPRFHNQPSLWMSSIVFRSFCGKNSTLIFQLLMFSRLECLYFRVLIYKSPEKCPETVRCRVKWGLSYLGSNLAEPDNISFLRGLHIYDWIHAAPKMSLWDVSVNCDHIHPFINSMNGEEKTKTIVCCLKTKNTASLAVESMAKHGHS